MRFLYEALCIANNRQTQKKRCFILRTTPCIWRYLCVVRTVLKWIERTPTDWMDGIIRDFRCLCLSRSLSHVSTPSHSLDRSVCSVYFTHIRYSCLRFSFAFCLFVLFLLALCGKWVCAFSAMYVLETCIGYPIFPDNRNPIRWYIRPFRQIQISDGTTIGQSPNYPKFSRKIRNFPEKSVAAAVGRIVFLIFQSDAGL